MMCASGHRRLRVGARLPSVRQLAARQQERKDLPVDPDFSNMLGDQVDRHRLRLQSAAPVMEVDEANLS